jgi:hypothetical protein
VSLKEKEYIKKGGLKEGKGYKTGKLEGKWKRGVLIFCQR